MALYLTLIKLINCQVSQSVITEMTFPVLLLRGQEGQGEGPPRGSSPSGAGAQGCACQYLLLANLHWLLEDGPDNDLAAVRGGEGALVAVVPREPAGAWQQVAQAEGGGQIHGISCGARHGHSVRPVPGTLGGRQFPFSQMDPAGPPPQSPREHPCPSAPGSLLFLPLPWQGGDSPAWETFLSPATMVL